MAGRDMNVTKIFLTTEIETAKTAASKARLDVLDILEENGFQNLQLPRKLNISNILRFRKSLYKMAKGSTTMVVEYPVWMKRRMYVVYLLCKLKGIRVYAIIHDLFALRFKDPAKKDMLILRLFDGLVSHNWSMTAWLKQQGYKKDIVNLNLFDYLLKSEKNFSEKSLSEKVKILYAGNLAFDKSQFVYNNELGNFDNFNLQLFGVNFDKVKMNGSKVEYKGVFDPGSPNLPENYHFGLIWDGTSLDTCDGDTGDYTRFNNPHKLSLYLAIGLPVIVWKEAAIAKFVEDNKVGIAISSLKELNSIETTISQEEFSGFLNNIADISAKVRKGYFLSTALDKLSNS